MKIGIDCRMYSSKFTGIGRYVFELVKGIVAMNARLKNPHEIVCFFNSPEFESFEPPKHVKNVLVNARHYSLAEQTKFLKILNREKLDLMHFTHFNVPLLYSRPYVVTIHDMTLSLFPGKKMNKWYHRLAYHMVINRAAKKSRKILTVSNNTKKDVIDHLKVPADKIVTTHIGLDKMFSMAENADDFPDRLEAMGISKQFLLYTGVWRNHKNLPRLLEALRILVDKGMDFQLVITGKRDPAYDEVPAKVKELGLEENVIFPGLVSEEDLVMLYNAAAIYVFPSLYEGFGLPPLEAMACGTPAVVSSSSCIPEVCGDAALYFDPYNPEDIAERIEKVHKDIELQAELVAKGLEQVKNYSWHDTVKKTFEIYKNV